MALHYKERGQETMKKLLILVAGVVMTIAPAMAQRVVVVGRPFGGFYGPRFYGSYWGPGYYGPYAYGFAPYANTGQVKIDTKVKDAEVYVNGAFAGTVKQVHDMHLRPGNYTIEVRYREEPAYSERVYVVAGKTVHLHPAL
jgi:hypothetical protein